MTSMLSEDWKSHLMPISSPLLILDARFTVQLEFFTYQCYPLEQITVTMALWKEHKHAIKRDGFDTQCCPTLVMLITLWSQDFHQYGRNK